MKIKDIQIDGFGVWSELTVHSMPDTMTVFYGPNEAGKTTLMNFVRTMFYGFTPDRKTRYLPPVHGGKPGGAIRVTGPGGGYEICRRAQLEGGAGGGLTVTGTDGLSQGQHRLAMLLGQVDESIFTNVFAIGLRELQELSTLDDTAAADELYKLSSGLDRVSLVDVTRKLRAARQQVVGATPDAGQMQKLLLNREKIKEEIEQQIGQGRRWNELASLRNTQNIELEELKQRIAQSELEAKSYEVALQVKPNWIKRLALQDEISNLGARTEIPESAAAKLAQLTGEIAEREESLEEIKAKRRGLREQARKLPLRRGILSLAAKIEAASEQTPWLASIQKNVQRLEGQIKQSREQLVEDAQRLGISEEDQKALLDDRRMANMPDLSRQAINQLAEPASEVRMWSTRLKQAKTQAETEKKEADRLTAELASAVDARGQKDIQSALKDHGGTMSLLRKRQQIQETLDRQLARRKQLESEAVDLTVDEALPVERSFMMGILFIGGMMLFLWGGGMMVDFWGQNSDRTVGMMMTMLGLTGLVIAIMYSSVLDKTTVSNLEEVEDQIDAIRKEIRKTEDERNEIERRLPASNQSLEARVREVEGEIAALESLLPVQHNLMAVQERYRVARKRASQAADSLQSAKTGWQRTLSQLGLAESLSPKSIRIMAEGYDSLVQTRKRIQLLEQELEARQLELGAITQRIDSLAKQVFAAKAANDAVAASNGQEDEFDDFAGDSAARREMLLAEEASAIAAPVRASTQMASAALEQLSKLSALVSSQEQYIVQKRSLKEQDQHLAKQGAGIQKAIDKLHRAHSSVLAENACESEEQLLELLELKAKHHKLSVQLAEFGERITAGIGGVVPYDTVARLLDGPGVEELEKRWEQIGQRTLQAESRVEQLHLRQGELTQEMKSLAASNRLAEAKLELVCVENQLKACGEHWQVLAVTTGLLDRVCEVYETERQPETLREASAFLKQLTEGKYTRIWTPLGKNQLRIDNAKGSSLPLEVLSRGTREAVFIALRLSLAAAYARRGVTIPLVLDDVFVNFDAIRTESAARVLRDFASLGHQVIMFTCHEHIMRTFDKIGVQVRVLPSQGEAGEADIYHPPIADAPALVEPVEEEPVPPPAIEEVEAELEDEPEVVVAVEEVPEPEPEPEPELELEPEPEPVAVLEPQETMEEVVESLAEAVDEELAEPEPEPEPVRKHVKRIVVVENDADIDWLWYERKPEADDLGWVESEERVDERLPPPDLWWNKESKTIKS